MDWDGLNEVYGRNAEQGNGQEYGQNSSFLANLTGVPDTDNAGQWRAMSGALADAGAAMTRASNPGFYGRTPSAGNVLSQGVQGFHQGMGAQQMLRRHAMIEEVKRKQAEQRMREEGWGEAARPESGRGGIDLNDPNQLAAWLADPGTRHVITSIWDGENGNREALEYNTEENNRSAALAGQGQRPRRHRYDPATGRLEDE